MAGADRERSCTLQTDDWVSVTECQSAKSDLQTRILHLTEAAQRESALLTATSTKFEQQVRTLLVELISSENSNIELIQRRRCATEVQKKELDCMQMTLGRVHRTYGHFPGDLLESLFVIEVDSIND